MNQRVTLDTTIPTVPVDQLPIFYGNPSSKVLGVKFVNTTTEFIRCSEDICFLINDNNVLETKFRTDNLYAIEQKKINGSNERMIQQIKNSNFLTPRGGFLMSSLGRAEIIDIEFVYYDYTDTHPYEHEYDNMCYPAWKLRVKTPECIETLIINAVVPYPQ